MISKDYKQQIAKAANVIGKTWPLYGFVTSNPLAGFEELPFEAALQKAQNYYGCSVLPSTAMFKKALENGEIDEHILSTLLQKNQFYLNPKQCLIEMEDVIFIKNYLYANLDRHMVKWLSVFMDEGTVEWEMPNREKGFYEAWKSLAYYDKELKFIDSKQIPKTANDALNLLLTNFSSAEQQTIFKEHLSALPGYTGYIKYRNTENAAWQSKYPITLEEYLAVRLTIAKQLNISFFRKKLEVDSDQSKPEVKQIWLQAWEKSFQHKLAKQLNNSLTIAEMYTTTENVPTAQFVFCIDTRSELLRRHIETKAAYETFGYAGFFGLATDYKDLNTGLVRKSCPPILGSAYVITEKNISSKSTEFGQYQKKKGYQKFADFITQRMKNMLPSAFGYVEGAGLFYGASIIYRTFFPINSGKQNNHSLANHENLCSPEMHLHQDLTQQNQIAIAEKVAIVKTAFDILGWKTFAPLVIFAGHGSHSANNPFGSSLDCGACAASPGRHNARMLAKLANNPAVRHVLKNDFNIAIPENTYFLGAEHDTTSDGIEIFDADAPETHLQLIAQLKNNLAAIQLTALAERSGLSTNVKKVADKKVGNWAETRPEWGLAKNAGFIIGPRKISKNVNLESRCFLNSYDWTHDPEGTALEMIMQGPMVVTQWINNHYYFSTVDNNKFGGGNKITHNVIGGYGVVQGNGGDLKAGLPLQSVNSTDSENFHQPLRLSVVIQAPLNRVEEILTRNNHLRELIDNEWIYLMVMDPLKNNEIKIYKKANWSALNELKFNQLLAS